MATYIKTLKEDNGDITYPQTTTDAVLTTSGTTLETELGKCVKAEEIGSTADITPTITTAMIKDSAVTTTKLADGAVTSNKIDWTTFSYSLNEVETGATWIDGKHIFKKTIHCNIAKGANSISHGISNFYRCIRYEGFFLGNGLMFPAFSITTDGSYGFYNGLSAWTVDSSNVNIQSSMVSNDLYLTIYYIKTS